MNWKEQLNYLERAHRWDAAIEFMKNVIENHPDDMDAYIFMNFLLMNLLVEEDYDSAKLNRYWALAKWYFQESYIKFSDNAEYLYLMAKTAMMSEWFFGIDVKDYEQMIEKAKRLEPDNLVYKENYYWTLSEIDPDNPEVTEYAQIVLSENSPIKAQLKSKGALGEYILEMKENWCKSVLRAAVPKVGKS